MASEDLKNRLCKSFETAKRIRAQYEDILQECSDYLLPGRHSFAAERAPGDVRIKKIFDSTGPNALIKAASGLYSRASNPYSKWFNMGLMSTHVPVQNLPANIRQWLDDTVNALRGMMAKPIAPVMYQGYLDALGLGTCVSYIEEDDFSVFRGKAIPLDQVYILEGPFGKVDTVFRYYKMTARQIVYEFEDGRIPNAVRQAMIDDPEKTFKIIHATYPRPGKERNPDQKDDPLSFPIGTMYVIDGDWQNPILESGYHEMPYAVLRLEKLPGEIWGRGPGLSALPDVRTLNESMRLILDASHMAIRPPMDVPSEVYITPFMLTPAAMNLNQDMSGRKASPLNSVGQLQITYQMLEERRAAVREAFFNDQLQLTGGPEMTAYEVSKRSEQQMILMGPWQGRLELEYYEPLINRCFAIAARAGVLPEPPEELLDKDHGLSQYYLSYESPLANAQRLLDVQTIDNTKASVLQTAQAGIPVTDLFNWDKMEISRAVALGLPSECIKGAEQVQQERQAQQEQQSQANAMQQMQSMAATAKDLGGAPEGIQEALLGQMGGGGGMSSLIPGQQSQEPQLMMPEQI